MDMEEKIAQDIHQLVADVREATDGGCHSVINFAPSTPVIEASPLFCRTGGTVTMVALPKGKRISIDLHSTIFHGLTIKGSIVGNKGDISRALAFASRGLVKCVIHIEPFSAINEVLGDLRKNSYEARVVLSRSRASGAA